MRTVAFLSPIFASAHLPRAVPSLVIASAFSVLVLYAWAAVCFSFFRFIRPETQDSQRHFLEAHYRFYTTRPVFSQRAVSQTRPEVTQQTIREAGKRGWFMSLPVLFTLSLEPTNSDAFFSIGVLLSCGVAFFGGLMFAYSWYGLRCFRMLGLKSYTKGAP
jgi:hypothetical protein